MIGNSNYIGTCLNGLIQNQELNELKLLSVSSNKFYINNNDRTAHFFGHSKLTPLDIVDFYKRKETNENMETEMKEMNDKLGKNDFLDDDNFDEAIQIQIRKRKNNKIMQRENERRYCNH